VTLRDKALFATCRALFAACEKPEAEMTWAKHRGAAAFIAGGPAGLLRQMERAVFAALAKRPADRPPSGAALQGMLSVG
jgi:hypothetical protein